MHQWRYFKFSITATLAIVSVIHQGTSYNVTLKSSNQSHSQWTISSVDKVGNRVTTTPVQTSPTISSGSSPIITTSSGSTGTTTSNQNSNNIIAIEQQAVTLLNVDRRANGLPNLQVDSRLTNIAQNHAQDMVNRKFFSHTNPDGLSPFDRMKQAGISYSAAGENIAEKQNIQAAEVAFMNSSGHRANILNSSYSNVGIGVAYDSNGTLFVVQDFIKP